MRPICISAIEICTSNITGIPRYVREAIVALDELRRERLGSGRDYPVSICCPRGREGDLNLPPLKTMDIVPLELDGNRKWNTDVFRKYVKKVDGIFCGLANNMTVSRGSIVTLHDVRALDSKEFETRKERIAFRLHCGLIALFASRIVTVSEYQREVICRKLGYRRKKLLVINPGWEHIAHAASDESIFEEFPRIGKGEFYYALGSVAKHKNYRWIAEAAKRNPDKQFVVAGGEELRRWHTDSGEFAGDNVIYVGYVSDGKNKALMENCRAFVQPSLYEGFGIPPLEALALGKPLFVSTATCLPEIYGKVAKMFAPDDYAVDLDDLMTPPPEEVASTLAKYSWKTAAKKWDAVFEKLSRKESVVYDDIALLTAE